MPHRLKADLRYSAFLQARLLIVRLGILSKWKTLVANLVILIVRFRTLNFANRLRLLESNLNAISRTPKIRREEMLQFVHPPQLIKLLYSPNRPELVASQSLKSLQQVYEGLDIDQDPWVIKMRSDPNTCNAKALNKALISNKT